MVAAKADGKAKIAAQLQMRPMPIQRVVCEFLLTDFYDGDGDDGDDDDGNDADDDVEEEEVCENLGASGGHDRPVSLQGHCQQSEHRGVDLWFNVQWTVDLDFSVLTHSDTIGEHADSAEDWAKYPMAIPHCDESGEVERWQVQNSGHKNGLSNQSYQQCL